MEIIDVIKSRRSVRKYEDKEIPREILEDIVDCGRLAPSGCNMQPWVFVVVTDREIKERIAQAAKHGRFIREAAACIAVFCRKDAVTPLQDASAATENMMIAATAYGLGTCWVNSYRKPHSEEVKAVLNCPDDMELMTLFAIGYPAQEGRRVSKKSLSEVMRWNSF